MATRKLSSEELQVVARLAKQWGKIVVKQAFGEQGPGLDVDFAQMEEVASAAARGLTEGALEAATAQQGQLLGEKQPCPQCCKLCTVGSAERPLRVSGGVIALREPNQASNLFKRPYMIGNPAIRPQPKTKVLSAAAESAVSSHLLATPWCL